MQITRDIRHDLPAGMPRAMGLPIGSGATESIASVFQLRVKGPGKAWKSPGLRGIMTIRGLVESDRWEPAWKTYASSKRREVNLGCAA